MRTPLLGAVALATILGPAGAAAAETGPPAAVAWWTQRAAAEPLGEGALEIASSVRGHESVAAVRVRVDADADQPRLVLTEVPGVAPAEGAGFRACVATSPWEPADAGAWDQRPGSDCSDAVEALRVDPEHWAVDIAPLLAGGGAVDVILEPSPQELVPGVASARVFTLTFATVEVVSGGAAGSEIPPGTVAPPVPTGPVTAGAPTAPVAPRTAPLPVSRPVGTPAVTTPPSPASDESALPTPTAGSAERAAVDAPTFDLVAGDDDRPWSRLLLLVPLSALAGVVAAAGRTTLRARTGG